MDLPRRAAMTKTSSGRPQGRQLRLNLHLELTFETAGRGHKESAGVLSSRGDDQDGLEQGRRCEHSSGAGPSRLQADEIAEAMENLPTSFPAEKMTKTSAGRPQGEKVRLNIHLELSH